MAGNRPTVYDVAEKAGVSIATVSLTFAHPGKVRASTRQAVEAAARELGYIPNASARGLAGGRTGALGLLTRAVSPVWRSWRNTSAALFVSLGTRVSASDSKAT